jgi:hypothetical protein
MRFGGVFGRCYKLFAFIAKKTGARNPIEYAQVKETAAWDDIDVLMGRKKIRRVKPHFAIAPAIAELNKTISYLVAHPNVSKRFGSGCGRQSTENILQDLREIRGILLRFKGTKKKFRLDIN